MKKFQALSILIVTGIVVGFTFMYIKQVNADEGVPNTAEAQEIKDVIQHSYTVFRSALRNGGDVSEFDIVFIDTDDYELPNKESREFIEKVYGPEIAAQAGYLSAMEAKYFAYGKAARMLRDAQKLADKENREVSHEELLKISDSCFGVTPPSVRSETGKPVELTYEKIDIQGERAVVRYDDGPALQEAILVFRDGRWLIASIVPINVHY